MFAIWLIVEHAVIVGESKLQPEFGELKPIEYTQVPAFAAFWAAVIARWHPLLVPAPLASPSLRRTITFVAPARALAVSAVCAAVIASA